jgi:hypothetical protein
VQKDLRITKLKEIANGVSCMTGIKLKYQGQASLYNAYKIPLDYLIYNKYNGRIGSLVKSHELQYRALNAETSEDESLIAKFLWDSKKERNGITMNDLIEKGQQRFGIVTKDGIIIDGNRRAMLLKRIWHERVKWQKEHHNVDECKYFVAVILPVEGITKDVMKLETIYQMGEDEKLDYDAVEKYLKCKDLRKLDFSVQDIANMMAVEEAQIVEWLEIMKLMDSYLEYLGYKGIYTRLEKREGQFVDLDRYLKRYETKKSGMVEWGYDKSDISDLRSVCFDYIRAQYEGKDFRYIAQPSKTDSVFCKEKVWNEFRDLHFKSIDGIKEKSIDIWRKDNPDADLTDLLRTRDHEWVKIVEDELKKNLGKAKYHLDNIKEANQPLALLTRAKNTMESVNTQVKEFYAPEVDKILKEMGSIIWEYKKLLDRKGKK